MVANNGHVVLGFDTDEHVVDRIQRRDLRREEPGLEAFVDRALESGNLTVSDEPAPANYHVICVPTPIDEDRKADLTYVTAAGRNVAGLLREGDTVILESTVPPRTTTDVLQPLLEQDGMVAGEDFSLNYSPETVLPGNIIHELRQNDRIVGSAGGSEVTPAVDLYDSFVEGAIHTTSSTMAEAVKLLQNTYRDVNIALANEIARLAHEFGINTWEAIELANRHPRVDVLEPGPGVGGHCIPVDPYFLIQDTEHGVLIEQAREINDGMVDHVVELLEDELGDLQDRKIAILGAAYKGNVADVRGSPAITLVNRLEERNDAGAGIDVSVTDPHVNGQYPPLETFDKAVADADVAIITTDHDVFSDLEPDTLTDALAERNLIDTKSVVDIDRWREAGFNAVRI